MKVGFFSDIDLNRLWSKASPVTFEKKSNVFLVRLIVLFSNEVIQVGKKQQMSSNTMWPEVS